MPKFLSPNWLLVCGETISFIYFFVYAGDKLEQGVIFPTVIQTSGISRIETCYTKITQQ